jgi:aspartate 4-decarboxylase
MPATATADVGSLSPFELKDLFITAARESARASNASLLNAGRGNPNWISTTPREAFFLLGRFGLEEARRARDEKKIGMAGMPRREGIGRRLRSFLTKNKTRPGAGLLKKTFDYGVKVLGFDADAYAHELADAIIGDN